jgi:hypothetical protein
MSHEFETLNQAASALLVETCALLNDRGLGYVVAGGWVPVLRSTGSDLVHPGTRDVDVLFNDDRQAIRSAVECMLKNGFILSAKHEFQLLRTLRVASREFVFNVDLMHPLEASANSEMFQDILDLEIRSDYDENRPKVKSICFPSSAIIFEQTLWSKFDVGGISLNGMATSCAVPLMDEVGLVLSKAISVKQQKRPRDAFDIYYVLANPHGSHISAQLVQLGQKFPQVSEQLAHLRRYLTESQPTFDANVAKYLGKYLPPVAPSEYLRTMLFP